MHFFTELAKEIQIFIANGLKIVIHNPNIHFLKTLRKKDHHFATITAWVHTGKFIEL